MALNDIRISQLPQLLGSQVTAGTVLTVVENGINYFIAIGDLASASVALPYFIYTKTFDNIIVDDTFQEIGRVESVEPQGAGVYRYQMDFAWDLNSTTSFGIFEFSIDAGVTWTEIKSEPKDKLDERLVSYGFQKEVAEGTNFSFILRARKSIASDIMNVPFVDLSIELKARDEVVYQNIATAVSP